MKFINNNKILFPVGVKQIPIYAFAGLDSITSIIIPDCVTSIGYAAFNGCDRLANVTIGSGITRIEDNVFKLGLTSVTIPDCNNLLAFRVAQLASVAIGNSVKNIGNYAFEYCRN